MFFFYVLLSEKTGMLYKGHCNELETRLKSHNQGYTKSTKSGRPWRLIYSEEFSTRDEAILREKQSKTFRGGKALHALLRKKNLLKN